MALLEVGPYLVDRLQDQCRSVKGVFMADALAGVLERGQQSEVLYVTLADYEPIKDDGSGDTLWRETWLVILVIKNVTQGPGRANGIYTTASRLLADVQSALTGWQCPPVTVGKIRAASPPAPQLNDAFAYFPLAFSVDVLVEGVSA
jgi:hypothetical protein